MTQRLDRLSFSRSAAVALAGFGLLSAALAGCASTSNGNTVPRASSSGQVGTASSKSVDTGLSEGPRNTGTFPNLNIPPKAATAQITPDEKTADTESLQAAQQAKAARAAGEAPTDPAVLRKLAATHTADTLKVIEGQ
ncbi:hypothetical protein SAZ10_19400 [Mesorhizobium sp. BAC0120]|uniref:hypothetical protein n=1 Tax=Mesorhizobium sp. BAC0120 TaxID=3090670 RepID=UPI00298D360C|nr:hypothetical protein [Mesorhizobium sp. BAC0120]MDW6023917.1 hypothetical protein [Mesorhizobium sp. BAC0120]